MGCLSQHRVERASEGNMTLVPRCSFPGFCKGSIQLVESVNREGSELEIGHSKICKLKIDISWCSKGQMHLALGIGKVKLWCASKCWIAVEQPGCRPGVCELQIHIAKKLSELTKSLI